MTARNMLILGFVASLPAVLCGGWWVLRAIWEGEL